MEIGLQNYAVMAALLKEKKYEEAKKIINENKADHRQTEFSKTYDPHIRAALKEIEEKNATI